MRLLKAGAVIAGLAAVGAFGSGTAAAQSPCDPITKAGNAIIQAQIAWTKLAYSDGVITPEEAAQATTFTNAIAKNTADLAQCISTGKLPPGYTPIDGLTPEEIQAKIDEACKQERDAIADVARANQRQRALIPVAEYMERLAGRTSTIAGVVAKGSDLAGEPHLGRLLKLESAILKIQSMDAKYLVFTTQQDIEKWDRWVAKASEEAKNGCSQSAAATSAGVFAPWPAPTSASAALFKPADPAKALSANLKAQRKAFKALKAALATYNSGAPDPAPSAAKKAAVQKRVDAVVKLVRKHGTLRAGLARQLKGTKLSAADLPRSLRKDKTLRPYMGKPLSKLFGTALAKGDKQLIAVLQGQIALP
jgi:hypothetical protein